MKKKSNPTSVNRDAESPTLNERIARLAELEAAIEKERAAIVKHREEHLKSLWRAFVEHVESAGSSVEAVMRLGGLKARRSAPKKQADTAGAAKQRVKPVYINPDDPSQTWSGRGRQARWLTDALAADPKKLLTDFLAPSSKPNKAT